MGDEIGLAAQEEAPGRSPSGVDVAGRPQHKRRSTATRVVGGVLSFALIVFIFVGVIPQFASYEVAWRRFADERSVVAGARARGCVVHISLRGPIRLSSPACATATATWRPKRPRRSPTPSRLVVPSRSA